MKIKKLRKPGRILASLTLALTLCLGFALPVAAEPGDKISHSGAAITKILKVPEGTTVPDMQFTFNVTKSSYNGDDQLTSVLPAISPKTLSTSAKVSDGTDPDTHVTTYHMESADIFAGVTWTAAGVYEYVVNEEKNTGTYTLETGESITYSPGKYYVRVYVEKNKTTGNFEVVGTTAHVWVPDNEDQTEGDKVDPTPGGGEWEPGKKYPYSQMVFNNTFARITDPGTVDPVKHAFSVLKTVTGNPPATPVAEFNYTVKITKPPVAAATDTTFKAYIMNGSTLVSTIDMNYNAINTFKLQAGYELIAQDAYVGTLYEVTELGPRNFTPSYTQIVGGAGQTPVTGTFETDLKAKAQLVTEAEDATNYTNKYTSTTPTGIIMNNLPFVLLIVIGIGALALAVVVRARKRMA